MTSRGKMLWRVTAGREASHWVRGPEDRPGAEARATTPGLALRPRSPLGFNPLGVNEWTLDCRSSSTVRGKIICEQYGQLTQGK